LIGSTAGLALGLPFHANLVLWLNAVEGLFATLAKQRLNRGVFHSLVSLQAAISRFVSDINVDPLRFHRTKGSEKIRAAVRCGYQVLDLIYQVLFA
jgi:hypothetical protein